MTAPTPERRAGAQKIANLYGLTLYFQNGHYSNKREANALVEDIVHPTGLVGPLKADRSHGMGDNQPANFGAQPVGSA